MQGTENKVSSQCRLHSNFRSVKITYFTHHNYIRILTQKRAECRREGQADFVVDINLIDTLNVVFNRILSGHDIDICFVKCTECAIQRRCFSATCWSCYKQHSIRSGKSLLDVHKAAFRNSEFSKIKHKV